MPQPGLRRRAEDHVGAAFEVAAVAFLQSASDGNKLRPELLDTNSMLGSSMHTFRYRAKVVAEISLGQEQTCSIVSVRDLFSNDLKQRARMPECFGRFSVDHVHSSVCLV